MASRLTNVHTLSWLIKNPTRKTSEKSSNFFLFNTEWCFQWSYSQSYGYPSYHLTLLQGTRKENLKRPLLVTVFCGFQNYDNAGIEGHTKLMRTTSEVIFSINANDLSCKLPESRELNMMCIFHDVTPSSTLQTTERITLGPDLESLTLDLGNLLKDQTFADAKLKCGDQTLQVHKTVLSARSEVFAAMFRNKMEENKTGIVEIKDMDVKVLELFLRYLYTGQIQNAADDLVPGLYATGDKYAVHALKKSCSDRMVGCLTAENCVGVLALADKHADVDLKRQVVAYICHNNEILLRDDWIKFSKENATLAVEVYQNFAKGKIESSGGEKKNSQLFFIRSFK